MNNTSGRTSDEKDEARHFYAVGTVLVRAIADEISEMALTGDGISRLELELLHVQLVNVYELMGSQTVFGMYSEDTYSDGTPVSIVVGAPSSRGWSAPGDVYDCGNPWLPNIMSTDDYDADGPIPPGCAVMVVDPPHRWRSKSGAVRQGRLGLQALENRLCEAER